MCAFEALKFALLGNPVADSVRGGGEKREERGGWTITVLGCRRPSTPQPCYWRRARLPIEITPGMPDTSMQQKY